ncbi:hypothetical protein LTS18_009769, partial [Coniosporium uncinatum]
MASLLRKLVAGPRAHHPESDLDLCYVTDSLIATSGPSGTYPKRYYRNPLDELVKFLDRQHGAEWAIWEFRAEGTGYPDSEVYGRVWHFPWPDHHPPPFGLVPRIMASMRLWLKGEGVREKGRVVVVHCKAGKGRSGTAVCSYLVSEEGWTVQDALQRFTERRMRPGFGAGVSIPSQLRWVGYVERWTKGKKVYVERRAEVTEVHLCGLREGSVKTSVEGFEDEGKVIKKFNTFAESDGTREGNDVIYKPTERIILPTSDIEIDFERRYNSYTMLTAVAHVWFNIFFEGNGPEKDGNADESGVFEIEWDAIDGLKGSSRKGTRIFDKLVVVWRAVDRPELVNEPKEGEEIRQSRPSNWQTKHVSEEEDISRANSLEGVQSKVDAPRHNHEE